MYLPWNDVTATVEWHELGLHFQSHEFWLRIYRKRWELAKNSQVWLSRRLIFAIEWHHGKSCTSWPWSKFSMPQIRNVVISETVRAIEKMFHTSFAEVDIRHWMAPLRTLYSVNLTFIFKVKHLFVMNLLLKKCADSGCPGRFVSSSTTPTTELLLFILGIKCCQIYLLHACCVISMRNTNSHNNNNQCATSVRRLTITISAVISLLFNVWSTTTILIPSYKTFKKYSV